MGKLVDKYGAPPFTVFNSQMGYWMKRKAAWNSLGLRPPQAKGVYYATSSLAKKFANIVSTFDPVLTELLCSWYAPKGGSVLDPFAGGAVRGVVAALLGLHYIGVELRGDQIADNVNQWTTISSRLRVPAHRPRWLEGDSADVLPDLENGFDLILSCPPYGSLERYSDHPRDLSAMPHGVFLDAYRGIIAKAVAKLNPGGFVCWVVGDFRDHKGRLRGLVPDTIQAFQCAGMTYYNDAILVVPLCSLPLRVAGAFDTRRKLGTAHQHVLIFYKGDPSGPEIKLFSQSPRPTPLCPDVFSFQSRERG